MEPDWTPRFSMRAHMCRTVVLLGTIFSAVALDAEPKRPLRDGKGQSSLCHGAPVVGEFEDNLSFVVSDAKQDAP
jgi:hypothetical protein